MNDNTPDSTPLAALFPLLYDELRRLAASRLSREGSNHSLQPTELVNEVFLKLSQQSKTVYAGRTHFLAIAAESMRRILVDHARAKRTEKRGGDWHRITLTEEVALSSRPEVDVLALDRALEDLAARDPRAARIAEMRFFAGMSVAEIAEELKITDRWVRDQWLHARAWLRRELNESRPG